MMFFRWWYGEAYHRVLKCARASFIFSYDLFSVSICFKTLFAPWKRDEISYEGLSLQQRFQVWTLNLSSRFIGLVIKLFTLLTYVVFTAILSAVVLLIIITWIFYPAVVIYFLLRAVNII